MKSFGFYYLLVDTTSDFYVIHLLSWFCNIFGMILILAAHEHYSIDVFIAFFLTSRLFLYYHSLANNSVLHSRSDTRLSIWFPMFSYFEKNVHCMVPNDFRVPWPLTYVSSHDEKISPEICENKKCQFFSRKKQWRINVIFFRVSWLIISDNSIIFFFLVLVHSRL